jgi:anaerobic selenocysteine-containing dehydrogenase
MNFMEESSTKLNRRNFLKVAGAAGAGAALVTAGANPLKLHALAPHAAPATARTEKIVASTCLQCPGGCGILVRVVDGRAVKIEGNPASANNVGTLCPKGQAGLQFLYDPDRIKGPMKLKGARGSGNYEQISWDQAIQEVAARLKDIREGGTGRTPSPF